jgi:hypothetical protein
LKNAVLQQPARFWARQLRDDGNRWADRLRLDSTLNSYDKDVLLRESIATATMARNVAFFLLQYVYHKETGRDLDNFEMDGLNDGKPDEPPRE